MFISDYQIKPLSMCGLFLSLASSSGHKQHLVKCNRKQRRRDKKLPKTVWMTTFILSSVICFFVNEIIL